MKDFQQFMDELEQQDPDALQLLEDTGPEFFSTEDLVAFDTELHDRIRHFARWQQYAFSIALFSPAWILLSGICWLFHRYAWAIIVIKLFPVFIGISVLTFFILRLKFQGVGRWIHLRDRIREEVIARQNKRKSRTGF